MIRFAAVHPPCGTEVRDRLPEGYPVSEGVGLWCRACAASWWAQTPAPVPIVVLPEPVLEPIVAVPEPVLEPPEPIVAAPAPAPVTAPVFTAPVFRTPAPLRSWLAPAIALAAFVLLAIAVASTAINPGGDAGQATAARPAPTPSPAAATSPAPATAPAPTTRTVSRRVAGRRLTLTVSDAWTVRRRANGITVTGPAGAVVRISTGPRRGRSLRALGRDARRALDRRSRAPLRRIRVDGRPAIAVTAAGQQVVQLADGRRRWLISRPRAEGARIVRSLRIDRA